MRVLLPPVVGTNISRGKRCYLSVPVTNVGDETGEIKVTGFVYSATGPSASDSYGDPSGYYGQIESWIGGDNGRGVAVNGDWVTVPPGQTVTVTATSASSLNWANWAHIYLCGAVRRPGGSRLYDQEHYRWYPYSFLTIEAPPQPSPPIAIGKGVRQSCSPFYLYVFGHSLMPGSPPADVMAKTSPYCGIDIVDPATYLDGSGLSFPCEFVVATYNHPGEIWPPYGLKVEFSWYRRRGNIRCFYWYYDIVPLEGYYYPYPWVFAYIGASPNWGDTEIGEDGYYYVIVTATKRNVNTGQVVWTGSYQADFLVTGVGGIPYTGARVSGLPATAGTVTRTRPAGVASPAVRYRR